jgi:hypothetical protein
MRWMLTLCLLAALPVVAHAASNLAASRVHAALVNGAVTVHVATPGTWYLAVDAPATETRVSVVIDDKPQVISQPWDKPCYATILATGTRKQPERLLLTPLVLAAGEHTITIAHATGVTFYPAFDPGAALAVPREARVAFPGDTVTGTLTVKTAARGTLYLDQLRLADQGDDPGWNRGSRVIAIARRREQRVRLTPGSAVAVPFPTDRLGLLGATLVLRDGDRLWVGALGTVLVAPQREMAFAPAGRMLATAFPDTPPWKLALLKRAGVDWLRTEIGWSNFEPRKGEYDWRGLDPFFAACRTNGLYVMNLASHAPRWAQPTGDFADVPYKDFKIKLDDAPGRDFFPDWTRAWTAYLTRYRDVSRAINLWNEPWEGGGISGWKSTGAHYRALLTGLKVARDAVDPGITIVAADCSHDTEWKIFSAGQADDIDVISTHYEHPKIATAYAQARHFRKEVWETETWEAWQGDAATTHRALYNLALGAKVVSYWHRDNLLDAQGNPSPELATLSALQGMLAGTAFREIVHPERPPFVLLFAGKDRQVAAVTTTLAPDAKDAGGEFRGQFAASRCTMVLDDPQRRCRPYDLYGNPLPAVRKGRTLRVPVDADVRYLVYQGSAGAFQEALTKAVYPGLRPVEIVFHDIPAKREPLEIRVTLRNATPNALPATVMLRDLTPLAQPPALAAPDALAVVTPATQQLVVPPAGAVDVIFQHDLRQCVNLDNLYTYRVQVDTPQGQASAEETLSVATIHTLAQHGALDEHDAAWRQATPVVVTPKRQPTRPQAWEAWQSWAQYLANHAESSAEVAFATDADHLYLIARVKDGTPRLLPSVLGGKTPHVMQNAPADYMYREMAPWPERDGDALTLSLGRIDGNPWLPRYEVFPPASPLYHLGAYVPARYVFLLYPTAEGAEVLRLRAGEWYYAHPLPMDYAWMAEHCRVPGARVHARRDKDGYVLTAALPWAAMPDVPHAKGDRIRLNLRLRDAAPGAPLAWAGSPEAAGRQVLWSKGRSLAGRAPLDYSPCGREQWSADTEFGFE